MSKKLINAEPNPADNVISLETQLPVAVTIKTPIEIALEIDDDGFTTAKKLYDWLELDDTHYSRWIKINIIDNPFAEEGIDFSPLMAKSRKGVMGRPTNDYKLSVSFAKKLAMSSNTERGEQARIYFLMCEKKLAELAIERQKFMVEREKGIAVRLSLTDIISKSNENKRLHGRGYSIFTNLVYRNVLGMDAKTIRKERNFRKSDNIRDFLSSEELEKIESVEQYVALLLMKGLDYKHIKIMLETLDENRADMNLDESAL